VILTKQQYEERVAMATALTAMGLKRGKSYHHNGASVYPVTQMYGKEYMVDPLNGLSMTYRDPYGAAIHFVNLVVQKWRG